MRDRANHVRTSPLDKEGRWLFVEAVDKSVLLELLDNIGVRHVLEFQARCLGHYLSDFGSNGLQAIPVRKRFLKNLEPGQILIGSLGFLRGLQSQPCPQELD
jgi:hypothetical protein